MPKRYKPPSITDQLSVPIDKPSGIAIRAIALAEGISYARLARKALQNTMSQIAVYNRLVEYLSALSDDELERERNLIMGGRMSDTLASVLQDSKEK